MKSFSIFSQGEAVLSGLQFKSPTIINEPVSSSAKATILPKLSKYKTRSTGTPAYLASLLESYRPARELRSSNKNLLTVPHLSLALSAKAFCVSAPTVWNSLSDACREAELVSTFRSRLKTELFNVAYVTHFV